MRIAGIGLLGTLWAAGLLGATLLLIAWFLRIRLTLPIRTPEPPFFLILRPFAADRTEWRRYRLKDGRSSLYGLLGKAVPTVLVGRPGDLLPPSGGQRVYVNDTEWKARVSGLIAEAWLVGYCPGRSESVRWEWSEVRRLASPQRVIVLLYGRHLVEGYAHLRAAASTEGIALPLPTARLMAVAFEGDWTPIPIHSDRTREFSTGEVTPGLVSGVRTWAAKVVDQGSGVRHRKARRIGAVGAILLLAAVGSVAGCYGGYSNVVEVLPKRQMGLEWPDGWWNDHPISLDGER